MNKLKLLFPALLLFFSNCNAQTLPSDFKLIYTSGGIAPWSTSETITIFANGDIEFVRIQGSPP